MINTKFLLLASACVLLSSSSQASEAENLTFSYSGSLLVNTYTLTPHTPMELKSISSLDNLAKLAAVCALGGGGCSGMSFGSSGNSTGLDTGSQCKDEGFVQSCPAGYVKDVNNICPHNPSYFKCRKADDSCKSGYSPTECDENETLVGSYQNEAGNTCYQCFEKPDDVKCEEKGYVKTCPDGQVKDENNTCPYNPAFSKCREPDNTCKTDYSLTECSSDQILVDSYSNEAGNTCYQCYDKPDELKCEEEGYVNACPSGKIKDENNICPYTSSYFKCREPNNSCDDGYAQSACTSEQVKENSYTNEAGNTCYQCRDKTCAEGGYATSLTSCQNGTAFSFANKTCYKDISDKTCEDGGYSSSCSTNQEGTSVSYCGKNCYSGCKQPSCEDGGYLSNTPANNVCKDITYYGRTCKTDCKQPSCSDGGYKNGIPTNNVCTQVDYYGTKCFKDCYQPTCDNGGYKDAVPSNQTCTPVTYYGRNCQKDCEPNEIQIACQIGSVLYEDKKCYSKTNKTPIAVVFDTDKKLAVALEHSPKTLTFGFRISVPGLEYCDIDLLACAANGKSNTAAIMAHSKPYMKYEAAEYCYNYTTAGTKIGEWFLPSYAEAVSLSSVAQTVNNTLTKLGSTSIYNAYWTSTSNTYDWTWKLYVGNEPTREFNDYTYFARPIISYGDDNGLWYHETEITCKVGSVLYSNKKCYTKTERTPIAVVFDADKKLAMGLTSPYWRPSFGQRGIDIPDLENCTVDNILSSCDTDGYSNTQKLIAFSKEKKYYGNNVFGAVEYCYNYITAGTEEGDWFLPSYAEFNNLWKVRSDLKAAFESLGETFPNCNHYWTSNEYSDIEAWTFTTFGSLSDNHYQKNNGSCVISAIFYGEK